MSRVEWLETVFIFIALGLLWVPILRLEHWLLKVALYACVPVLLWIAWRRWQRFKSALQSFKREEDETFFPLPSKWRQHRK